MRRSERLGRGRTRDEDRVAAVPVLAEEGEEGVIGATFLLMACSARKQRRTATVNGARVTWLAQSQEHVTLDLGVMSSSLTLGMEIT